MSPNNGRGELSHRIIVFSNLYFKQTMKTSNMKCFQQFEINSKWTAYLWNSGIHCWALKLWDAFILLSICVTIIWKDIFAKIIYFPFIFRLLKIFIYKIKVIFWGKFWSFWYICCLEFRLKKNNYITLLFSFVFKRNYVWTYFQKM